MTDHLSLAALMGAGLQKSAKIANVTDVQSEGERNPRATFTVVGTDGSVCSVVVKRLMMGQPGAMPVTKGKGKLKEGN